MKLKVVNGIVVQDSTGNYTVPDSIPMPIFLERFEIVDGNISIVNRYIGMTNDQVNDDINEMILENEFKAKVSSVNTKLIAITEKKILDAEKLIIDKEGITDGELASIKRSYDRKYKISKDLSNNPGALDAQASVLGMTPEDLAIYIINEYERSLLQSNISFDMIEARRLIIGQSVTTREEGLDEVNRMLIEFSNEHPSSFLSA